MKKNPLYKLDVDIYEKELENGLKIFVIPKNDVNNIYATFSTNYGSIHNEFVPIGQTEFIKVPDGIAHFLEHKVFEQKDGVDPFTFYSKSGTDCNANTSNFKTTYLFIGQEKLKENLNYLLDFVGDPYFTEENVEKEKGIIEQEIKMYQDDPISSANEKIIYNTFSNHPIRIPIGGTIDSIRKITKEDLYTCYNTFYHPSNMFVVVSGNVDPKEVIDIIEENQKNKKYKKIDKIQIKECEEKDNVYKKEEKIEMNVTIPKVLISYKINIENSKLDTRTITNFIGMYADLKFGPVSLLTEKLKQKELINKDIIFSTTRTNKHIALVIEISTNNKQEIINIIDEEIRKNNIKEQEFNRKKKTSISSCIYMSDSIYGLNSFVMNSLINDKKVNYNIYEHYKKLNYEDFMKFINNINFDNKSILYVEPKK